MTKGYHFKGLLTENGWLENVTVYVDDLGKIESIIDTTENAELVDGSCG